MALLLKTLFSKKAHHEARKDGDSMELFIQNIRYLFALQRTLSYENLRNTVAYLKKKAQGY